MVQKCIYCGKKSEKGEIERKRTFHKFPDSEKYPDLLKRWIANMNLKSNIKISKYSRLCSDHFEKQDLYIINKNIYLKPGSVPILFTNNKVQCTFCKANKGTGSQSFHKFPMNKPDIMNTWLSNMKIKNFYPTSNDVLCSDHFERNCFLRHGQRKSLQLKRNAIPTIFTHSFISESSLADQISSEIIRATTENDQSHQLHENMIIDDNICIDPSSMPEFESPENQTDQEVTIVDTSEAVRRSILTVLLDHNYTNSARTIRQKYLKLKQRYILQSKALKVNKQRISRLEKKVADLKDIISELRKSKAAPESGLVHLNCLADADTSQFLQRYTKNKSRIYRKK